MAHPRTTTMRLTSEEFAILDATRKKTGILSRSEALRFALRKFAECEGLEIGPAAKPKPKRSK